MKRFPWVRGAALFFVAVLVFAVGAAALPDNPYQRWQLIENTLYANATWSYERIHFDPEPIDVAILGSSRTQLGLSAPRVAAKLAADGVPLHVANLSVIEDGRNIEWAVANELFKAKAPRVIVMVVGASFHQWGHPGFKYVAPALAVAAPPAPFLHNSLADLIYLPYRQMTLFAAYVAPGLFDLRPDFDPARFAAKPVDYSVTQTLPDGKTIDMDGIRTAEELRAERKKYVGVRPPSRLPRAISRFTDIDEPVYTDAILRLAHAHGTRVIFVYLPEFEGATEIATRAFYDRRGPILELTDMARNPAYYQSFAHLNHRGAIIASDRVAGAVEAALRGGTRAGGGGTA